MENIRMNTEKTQKNAVKNKLQKEILTSSL